MTLDEYNKRIVEPGVNAFLEKRGQTAEEFIAECDGALAMSRRVLNWARTGEWDVSA